MKTLKYKQTFYYKEFEPLFFDLNIVELPLNIDTLNNVFEWVDIKHDNRIIKSRYMSKKYIVNDLLECFNNGCQLDYEKKPCGSCLWWTTESFYYKKDKVKPISYYCDFEKRLLLRVETKDLVKYVNNECHYQLAIDKVITAYHFF